MPTVSMLASVADLAASQAAGAVSQLLPSGIILPFGGATPPAGWLFCNGQLVNRTTYSSLFSAIGTVHGSGDGSTTFHLPDLRGRFLRGTDTMSQGAVTTAAGRDPDRAGRLVSNTGGNTGDAVGSVQTNATAKNSLTASVSGTTNIGHTHAATSISTSNTWHDSNVRMNLIDRWSPPYYGDGSTGQRMPHNEGGNDNYRYPLSVSGTAGGQTLPTTSPALSGTVTVGAGDNETRPLNANVNYIIKV